MQLDLGGIAKGYILDQALLVLGRYGVTRALIQAGGDIVAGEPPPRPPRGGGALPGAPPPGGGRGPPLAPPPLFAAGRPRDIRLRGRGRVCPSGGLRARG